VKKTSGEIQKKQNKKPKRHFYAPKEVVGSSNDNAEDLYARTLNQNVMPWALPALCCSSKIYSFDSRLLSSWWIVVVLTGWRPHRLGFDGLPR
jgi:hypothetical protein